MKTSTEKCSEKEVLWNKCVQRPTLLPQSPQTNHFPRLIICPNAEKPAKRLPRHINTNMSVYLSPILSRN